MTAGRKGDWIQTFTGRQFWPLDPRPGEIDLLDIAHALSMLCRFGGHCREFYSVAEHSVHVSRLCPPGLRLAGLLHDAAEAYLVDLPRPIKRHVVGYKDAERAIEAAIAEKFGVPADMPEAVRAAHEAMLAREALDIMETPPAPWTAPAEPADVALIFWEPRDARAAFLREFAALTGAPA